jgi:hypothetical protein
MEKTMKTLVTILAVVMMISSAAMATTPMQAAANGADYLINMQFVNGGWGWLATSTSTTTNTTGATGQGMLRAYDLTGNTAYLNSAKAAASYQMTVTYPSTTNPRFATGDPYFMLRVSQQASDNTWSNYAATNFYGSLANGTYGASGKVNTAGWISSVQTGRAGAWVNLLPWEFSTLAYTATQIGQSGQAALFETAILNGLNTLDNTAPDTVYSDLLGVAGGVRGLALDGTFTFTAISSVKHAGINGISTLTGLADYLAGKQNADGSWYWHSNLAGALEGDKDTQTTAYAILALEAAAQSLGSNAYDSKIALGRNWLTTMQDSTGGFLGYPGDTSALNMEVTGEAVAALPEPATMTLLGLGGLLFARKKK